MAKEIDALHATCPKCDWCVTVTPYDCPDPHRRVTGLMEIHRSKHPMHLPRCQAIRSDATRSDDPGMSACGSLDSEKELQEWLEGVLEKNDWTVLREVSPYNSDFKADFIVSHDDYGWFGIETKYFDMDGGAKMAEAHHQITRKYRGRTYLGEQINLWCLCPYFKYVNDDTFHRDQNRRRNRILSEFCTPLGIGYINLNTKDTRMDFAHSDRSQKVPLNLEYDDFSDYDPDIGLIEERVQAKRERYDYV